MKNKYLEMKTMADKIEELRKELYQNEEHRKLLLSEGFQYIDDKLFHIQSELRNAFEFCILEVVE